MPLRALPRLRERASQRAERRRLGASVGRRRAREGVFVGAIDGHLDDLADLATALPQARREAQAAFGNPTLYLERLVERPRHIEVQIFADAAGETVLVLGAAGGVGTAAIQIAKAMGARVIAAASTDEKCALCKSIGADVTINYGGDQLPHLRDAIKAATDGKGPDVIYDPVGGDFAEPAFRSIAWRGRYLVVGFASGPIPALPLNLALLKGASIVGVFWGDFAKREPKANAAMMAELASWYAQGKVKPVIDRTMPMAELKAAYAHMGSRGVMGKLVMVN